MCHFAEIHPKISAEPQTTGMCLSPYSFPKTMATGALVMSWK